MDYFDIILAPFYLILLYTIAYAYRHYYVKDLQQRKYFIPALTLKFIGSIFFGLIYQFYYGGGDTFNYFAQITVINHAFLDSPWDAIRLIFASGCEIIPSLMKYTSQLYWWCDSASYFVIRVGSIFSVFCFNSYVVISFFFAFISFMGLWNMYTTLCKHKPQLKKHMAWACFFVPSVFFWGSGLMKDTLTIGALGYLFWSINQLFVDKKVTVKAVLVFIISALVIQQIKIYILICFIPAAGAWLFLSNVSQIKNRFTKMVLSPLLLIIAMVASLYIIEIITIDSARYNIDTIGQTSKNTAEWIYYVGKTEKGSAYYLGEQDGTLLGMLNLALPAINVSLYRPYLWEINNVVMLLAALESLAMLILTVVAVIRLGFKKLITLFFKDYVFLFCVVFTIIFAFSVGVTSYNFGSLVRYKIPMMPFFLSLLFIMLEQGRRKRPSAYDVTTKGRQVINRKTFDVSL